MWGGGSKLNSGQKLTEKFPMTQFFYVWESMQDPSTTIIIIKEESHKKDLLSILTDKYEID